MAYNAPPPLDKKLTEPVDPPVFCRSPYCECPPGKCRAGYIDKRGEPVPDVFPVDERDQPAIPMPAGPYEPLKSLPYGSEARKEYPVNDGVLAYFPAAIASVARISKIGNDKHNPGEELHHARGKSMDHRNCIVRHVIDINDIEARIARSKYAEPYDVQMILEEAGYLAWRALALNQELHERFGLAPLAPRAR